MPYQMFHEFFPEIAEEETRSITLMPGHVNELGLPPDQYAFIEMFCNEEGCDCRRVFFGIVASKRKGFQAVIAWGWESAEFYKKWMREDDPTMVKDLRGPVLNLGSPETELGPGILKLVERVLLHDAAFVDRVKKHYGMFRARIDGASKTRAVSSGGRKKKRR